MNRNWRILGRRAVAAGCAGFIFAVGVAWQPAGPSGPLAIGLETAAAADLDAEGLAAVNLWMGALVKGDAAGIKAVLAPEFQIMRADGGGYAKDDYLATGLPKIAKLPEVSKLVATGSGDLLIARYMLTIDETINGKATIAHAPRLTVFRKSGGAWLVVAHANFAQIEK